MLEQLHKVFLVFENAEENKINYEVAAFFEKKVKKSFLKLEKSIGANWRLHKNYIDILGALTMTSRDKKEASE